MRKHPRLTIAAAATLCLLLLGATAARAATYTVTNTQDSGAGSLRDAITQANSTTEADTIEFQIPSNDAGCTGGACIITLTSGALAITSDMTINGPGASRLNVRRSDASPAFRIFEITQSTTILSGLTISNGNSTYGGGIFSFGIQVTVTDCVISDNVSQLGGGIYTYTSKFNLINSTVSGNKGKGIFTGYGAFTNIVHSVVSKNQFGGIASEGSKTINISDGSIITENFSGDGISLFSVGTLNVSNSSISNNKGGAIYEDEGGTITIDKSIISGNVGYIAITTEHTLTINDSIISDNIPSLNPSYTLAPTILALAGLIMNNSTVSNNNGSGIHLDSNFNATRPAKLTNCTISGNKGWGIEHYLYHDLIMTNCTVTKNGEGGIVSIPSGSDTHNVLPKNTIVANNGGPDIKLLSPFVVNLVSLGHNLIGDGGNSGFVNGVNGDIVGTASAPVNPLLGPLQDNGGQTLTHALLAGSPAINAGDNCVTEATHCFNDQIPQITTDERGFPRPADNAVDIGAYELQTSSNPLDTPQFFVRQQYLDFLNREPDSGGLSYWTNQINQCGADAGCINRKRVDVSAAFFISDEFQQTGSFVYRLYKAAFGVRPSYAQFTSDRARITGGQNLEANKASLADEFVRRAEFQTAYPDSMSNWDYVNKLFDTANLKPYTAERQARIVALNLRTQTRAQVLRDVAEMAEFKLKEYNRAFVLMQYFGYLKREPDEAGYQFWLNVLNSQGSNGYRGMVCSFITSQEYQQRFSSVVTHTNSDCQ